MNKLIITLSLLITVISFGQNKKSVIYESCTSSNLDSLETCFSENIKKDFLDKFKTPQDVIDLNFKGKISTFFSVTASGEYVINYVNASYPSINEEISRVFKNLPKSLPATYNGRNVDTDFVLPFLIPIEDNYKIEKVNLDKKTKLAIALEKQIKDSKNFPELSSSLSIPFTHQEYALINKYYTKTSNNHTAVKPYFYSDINYDSVAQFKANLYKKTNSTLGKKLWNDPFFMVKGKDYWVSMNPIFDFQIGKDNSDMKYTYNNTRALNVKGGIGKLNFTTTFYESQGRFAKYLNDYMRYLDPANSHAVVLGRGNAKKFKDGGFDYPVAEASISYNAGKHFNLQFGNGKNFIGDGYRSLFLSDAAAPYTFAKISTTFWKVKYTNIWMWANDVRPSVFENGTYLRKFVASHHLSINLTKKLNIGLFESTITNRRSGSKMDINFVNPVIFYRAVEFSRGSKSGNAIIGLNAKYQLKKNIDFYGQFVLDEVIVGEIFKNNGFWANKFGFQLGFHYYDAFKIKNLSIQGETNIVRPFTYSHNDTELNYTHYYQPLAHVWGSNFMEAIGIVRYQKERWFTNAKLVYGKKGFDFENNPISYGGDLFLSYQDRTTDYNNTYYQGNTATIFIADLQAGYIINPTTNLQLFGNFSFRHFKAKETIPYFTQENTNWFSVGLKTSIFNTYNDF